MELIVIQESTPDVIIINESSVINDGSVSGSSTYSSQKIESRLDEMFIGFERIQMLSQAAYDAIETPDSSTLYVII